MAPGKRTRSTPPADFHPDMEAAVGVSLAQLAAFYAFDRVKGFGPQKYKQLHEEGVELASILEDPQSLRMSGKRGDAFRAQLQQITSEVRAECLNTAKRQIGTAHHLGARIVSYNSPEYPRNVYDSNNPIAVLYVRGNPAVLKQNRVVACVGSRGIRPPYTNLQSRFAETAVTNGFAISSGFALGADTVAHLAARDWAGQTICCMPGGLDRPFPPENRAIWEDFLGYNGAVFVTEFPFGTRASTLTLRKRNKLIVAFALAVVVGQSSESGGAMNAYRFCREQKKPLATFEADGTDETSGNALIAKERKEADAIFPDFFDERRYVEWLRTLSSST